MRATAELPIEKIIITSVVSPFVTYTLLDAYRILVAHERRHLEQAERVMSAWLSWGIIWKSEDGASSVLQVFYCFSNTVVVSTF
jgi:hypothetical protein